MWSITHQGRRIRRVGLGNENPRVQTKRSKMLSQGNYYYDSEKEMLLQLGRFQFCFMNLGLYLWPFEISAKITVLNSPCTMKCFLRTFVPIWVESVLSFKSGYTEISGCSINKYCAPCLWGLTNISFSLWAVKLRASAFKLHDSFWDFSESK